MAKSNKNNKRDTAQDSKDLQQYLAAKNGLKELQAQKVELDKLLKAQENLAKSGEKLSKSLQDRLKFLQEENKYYSEREKLLKTQISTQEKNIEKIREAKKARQEERAEIKKSIEDLSEYETAIRSIANDIGKTNDLYETSQTLLEGQQTTLKSISSAITTLKDGNEDLAKKGEVAVDAYKDMYVSIAQIKNGIRQGTHSMEDYNEAIQRSYKSFQGIIDSIDTSTEDGKKLAQLLKGMQGEMEGFNKSAQKSEKTLNALNTAMDELGSSGIPLMGELSKGLKGLANKDIPMAKAGFLALGAALGTMVGKYFTAPFQVDIEMRNERIENQIGALRQAGVIEVEFQAKGGANALSQLQDDGRGGYQEMVGILDKATTVIGKKRNDISTQDIYLAKEKGKIDLDLLQSKKEAEIDIGGIANKLSLERQKSEIDNQDELLKLQIDAGFAAERAANAFYASMKSAAAEFRAASKTALFGNKLGSVGYGAAQLQMAGISADKVASAMNAASDATGKMPSAAVGADMAVMAERTGQSVENIATINEYFQRTDKVSADVAMNMQEGMRAMADNAGISLGSLMTEVAEASKDALSYQIKSGPALAKQVAYAKSLGVNFGDIAKAGKSMVLNYKDSIKAEMQLSTLLGKQVDLSEVREKFASGDTEGAMKALKAQGLDPKDMDMFQQEALSQALGGMDLSSLQKIATKTGKTAELGEGKAGAANQDFLKRSQAAQQQLSAEQAQISAEQAIIDAKTSQKALEAYLNDPKTAELRKKAIEQQIKEQEFEAEQRKKKLEIGLSQELTSRQKFINELDLAYNTLVSNMETMNPKIKQARTEQKQFEPEKTASEYILPTVSAIGGTMLANTLQKKVGGMIEKNVMAKTTAAIEKNVVANVEKNVAANVEKSIATKVEGEVAENIEKNLLKNISKKNLFLAGAVGVGTMMAGSAFGGDKKEANAPKTNLMAMPTQDEYMNAVASTTPSQTTETVNAAEMNSGFSNLCSCVSALGTPLSEIPGLTTILERQAGYSQMMVNLQGKVGDAMTKGTLITGAVSGVAELTVNAVGAMGKTIVQQVVGKAGAQTMGKAVMGSVASGGALAGAGLGVAGAVLSGFGDMEKQMAVMSGSMEQLNTGRWLDVAGKAATYASYGMIIGSIIPGVGNVVGGVVGGIIGGAVGIFQNFFSSQSEEEKRMVEERKKQIEAAEQNKAAIEHLIYINEEAAVQAAESRKQQESLMSIASNEEVWRASMLAQTIQMTELLDVVAFKDMKGGDTALAQMMSKPGGVEKLASMSSAEKNKLANTYVVGGKEVYRKDTDQSKQVAAGYGIDASGGLSERLTNIMKSQQALAQGGKGTVNIAGKDMTWADYTKTYKVSDAELKQIAQYQQLQQTLAGAQAKGLGVQPTTGATVAQTGTQPATTAQAGTKTAATAAPATGATATAAPAAAIPPATEATLLLIQQQADARGIIIAGKMDLINTTLNSIATGLGGGSAGLASGLSVIADQAAATARSTANMAKNNFVTAVQTLKLNEKVNTLNNQTAQLVQVNKNLQKLIDAFVSSNSDTNVTLQLDGRTVSRSVVKYNDNTRVTNPEPPATPTPSDFRLKKNIQLIGKSESGINIYTYEYIEKVNMSGVYQGVMAQELIGTKYESALILDGEYYKVDYTKLDVDFIRIN